MVKVKLLNVSLSPSLFTLGDWLLSNPYSVVDKRGFDVQEYDDSDLSSSYVERVVTKEVVVDPFGNESEVEVARYLNYSYTLHHLCSERYLMFVFNPPRSLKPLITSLSEYEGGNLFFGGMDLDVEEFMEDAKKSKYFHVDKVDKVKAKGVQLSKSTFADVMVSSSKEAYDDLKDFVGYKKYKVSSLRMDLRAQEGKGKLEISSSGLLSVDRTLLNEVLDFSIASLKSKYSD